MFKKKSKMQIATMEKNLVHMGGKPAMEVCRVERETEAGEGANCSTHKQDVPEVCREGGPGVSYGPKVCMGHR